MKTIRPLVVVFCATLAFASARATTVIPPTFDQLVTQAEIILEGTVTEVTSQWIGEGGQRRIVSYVTVQVEEAIKGEPGATYTLRMLGGQVGEDRMEISDAPKFEVGDRDILFVENNGTQFIPLVGIMHGRFHVEQDKATGADMILANNGDAITNVQNLGREGDLAAHKAIGATPNAVERPLDAESFKTAIRSRLASAQK